MALDNNILITVTIKNDLTSSTGIILDDDTDYTFQFTTRYEPLFSSINIIRGEIGGFISDVPDDTINLLIYENSVFLNERAETTYTTYTAPYEYRQWTKCKTEYDLLHGKLLKFLQEAGRGQGDTKKLGDLSISRTLGGTGTDIARGLQPALDKAKKCYEFWWGIISGGSQALRAIKGSTATVGVTPQDIRFTRNWEMLPPSTTVRGANRREDRYYSRRARI